MVGKAVHEFKTKRPEKNKYRTLQHCISVTRNASLYILYVSIKELLHVIRLQDCGLLETPDYTLNGSK